MNGKVQNLKKYEDFRKVFEIFRHYPFFEAWSEEAFKEEFEYLKDEGEIFGYYANTGEVVGLISLIYGAKKEHPVEFDDPDRVIYLSDIAVLDKYRGNGYAKRLADFVIDYASIFNYYQDMYFRTNLEGSMSEGIFVPRGFEVMTNNGEIITQDIYFERTKPELSTTDTRKFLSRKLQLK